MGACINEQLRLIVSVTMIPKRSITPQTLVLEDGRVVKVPAGTFQHFCASSVHRNPGAWPHVKGSLRTPGKSNDLDDFVPERWILSDKTYHPSSSSSPQNNSSHTKSGEKEEVTGHAQTIDELENGAMDIGSGTLFHPRPGAFIPFSDGPRACLGRRFAMVELVAVTATLFKDYSVELDTREWASEEEVKNMDAEGKRRVYQKAQDRAWQILEKELGGTVTLQCIGRKVGVRVCKRGEEMFTAI